MNILSFNEIENHNYGHFIFKGVQPQWLTLLKPTKIKYEPFKKSKYAVLSLFTKTSNMKTIQQMMDANKIVDFEQLDFLTKYITPVLVYMLLTQETKLDYSFRMYFDKPSYLFWNNYTLEQIPIHEILSNSNLENFVFNDMMCSYHRNQKFQKALSDFFKIFSTVKNPDKVKCGDFFISAFYNTYKSRYSDMEVMLYDLTHIFYTQYGVQNIDYRFMDNTFQIEANVHPHCDEGCLGQVVRTFIFRQKGFNYESRVVSAPDIVLIRDAHRCPSTKFDELSHINRNPNGAQFTWVHNHYYYVGWHKKANGYQKRGPIFYYINAYRPKNQCMIMNDTDWCYTFGRILGSCDSYTFSEDEKQARNQFNNNENQKQPLDHPGRKHKKGLGYGIDEYLSLYVVYDEKDNNACEKDVDSLTQQLYNKSNWINMYYNWQVFPVDRKLESLAYKEGLAFAACVLHMCATKERWIIPMTKEFKDVTIFDLYSVIETNRRNSEDTEIQRLVNLVPPSSQIHGIVGLSHEGETNMHKKIFEIDNDILLKFSRALSEKKLDNESLQNKFIETVENIYKRETQKSYHVGDEYKQGWQMRHAASLDHTHSKILGNNCELDYTKWQEQYGGSRRRKKNLAGGINPIFVEKDYEVFNILRQLVNTNDKNKILQQLQEHYTCYYDQLIANKPISKCIDSTPEEVIEFVNSLGGEKSFISSIPKYTPPSKFDQARWETIKDMKLFDLADMEFVYEKPAGQDAQKEVILNMPIYDYISGMDDFSRTANSRELREKVYKLFTEQFNLKPVTNPGKPVADIHCVAEGGKPKKEYVIYNKRKYLVRYDKRTKYILVNKVPMKLKDIKYKKMK